MATCLSTRQSPRIAQSARLSWHRMKTPGVRFSRSSQMLPSPTYTSEILNGTLSANFSLDCGFYYDVATIEQLEIEWIEHTWLRVKSDNPNIKENHALLRCFSHADASSRSNCPLTAMALTCSCEIFCIDAPATIL
jgi:hypothetical protein